MKPIEEGCRAVLVNCRNEENNGIIVTVGKRLGELDRFVGIRWQIDKEIVASRRDGTGRYYTDHAGEINLRRLPDNNEKLSSWGEVEKITKWNPTKVPVHE